MDREWGRDRKSRSMRFMTWEREAKNEKVCVGVRWRGKRERY